MRADAGRNHRRLDAWVLALLVLASACQASASTGTAKPTSLGQQQAWKTYRDAWYGIALRYPAKWQAQGDHYPPYFGGKTGFVTVDLLSGGRLGLRAACRLVANNTAHPYGTHPKLSSITVDGLEACLIWPSRDQEELEDDAAAIVVPRSAEPPDDWRYLRIDADKGHIRQIATHIELFTAEPADP